MERVSTLSRVEGHLTGGPRRFRHRELALLALAVLITAAAAAAATPAVLHRARRSRRPLEIYRDLGFFTGTGQFPAVASISTLAGPADSTWVLFAMSVPNNALRFQRDAGGFHAEYRLDVMLMDADSAPVRRFTDRQHVRVATFAETGRADESIIYQQGITAAPGHYIVRLEAADANSSRGFRTIDTITVPDYARAAAVASPMIVYEARGRSTRDSLPDIILNPRRTMPYGGEDPLVYIESYNAAQPINVRVLDDHGALLWTTQAALQGSDPLRSGVINLPADVLPLGRFSVEATGPDAASSRTPLVMTISDQWLAGDVEDVLKFLRYIAFQSEIDSLRVGSPADQRAAWERFWHRRDPLPVTEINEFRDQFFQRVRYATEAFREPGSAGWETDRGEVFIVLGAPDHVIERYVGTPDITGLPNAEEWVYLNAPGGRLSLLFHDRTSFGRRQLTPSSASAFRSVAERLKARPRG
jgi:GWxTD domain-containing protein